MEPTGISTMASESPRKSTRAAATRRKAPVIDSDDEENRTPTPEVKNEEEEDFTPAPAPLKTGRGRGRPKKAAAQDVEATPKPAARRRTRVTESTEPTQLFTPAPESSRRAASPSKAVPKKRGRKPRASVAPPPVEETSHLLTPEPSASPEPNQASEATEATITPDSPMADTIMGNTEEETTPVPEPQPEPAAEITQIEAKEEMPVLEPEIEVEPIADPQPPAKAMEELNTQQTMLEPIDIVVKRRAAAIPAMHEPVAPAQRTVITWLVLNNFKSYAGRQEVGPFHASFSSVVGPNGSGKSNVIDSLLFVFGFRASKMRQSKLSALIHNSAAFPDLDYCEVEVHFQEVKDLPNGSHEVIPDSQLVHVEKEKSGLEEKKNKALAYIRDENELASKQSTLYQIYISEFDDHIQVTQESVGQLQTQLDEELQKHQGSEGEIKELEKQYKKGVKECEQLEKRNQEFQKEVARIDKETVKFEEKKKFLAGKQKKLEKTKETSYYGRSEAESLAKQYAEDLERYNEEIVQLEESMKVEEKELEAVRKSLAGKTQGLSDEIAAKQKTLEPWNAKINEKQSAIAVAQSELDIMRERENAGAKGIAEVEAKIESLEEAKQIKATELAECKAERKRVEKDVQKAQAKLEEITQKEPTLRSKLSGARAKADEARASLSSAQTQGNVLTGLMRLKESGRIDGFHGRLGNLGTIDQKYDVAISTACPQLDNMVVDTVESGQQCIEYLRKNNLGRANFILLDRLAKRDMSPVQTPENVPRLFDLVKPKHDKLKPAFFQVMTNTLVAEDLDQAERIAYGAKRWRVVTLDGKLIDTAGTMSGGGSRVVKGKMSSKLASDVSRDQVTKLEQDRDTLEQTFIEFQQELRELETSLRDLNQQIPELDTKSQKLALELESFDRNIADCQRRIQELGNEQTSTKTDKGRISSLEKNIASMEKEVSKLRSETEDIEAEIKALQDKIMEIGGVKLRGQKAKVDGLKGQIDTLTEQASNAEVSKSKEEKQRTKHEKAHADAIRELEKLAIDAEKVEEDMASQQRDVSGIRQQAEEAQEELETKKEELLVVKKELDEKTTELNETRAIEIEMRNKLEEGQKTLNEFQRKQAYFHDKLSKLAYQSVTDLGDEQEGSGEGLPSYSKDELEDMDKAALKEQIAHLEKKNESTQVDLAVLAEYRKRVDEHAARSTDLAAAVSARDAAKNKCEELRRLHFRNVSIVASYIKERTKNAQFIVISLRNNMFELASRLVGVYKVNHMTKSVTIENKDYITGRA
ncbi:nuclear condensin complex subunit smc4 [Pyrenophora seminiperda CCB06]|uniref:Nuclear condensin complex subunit smc4 n=1 Tax=Pyrenophora seminiperda CCB06 TaxID=1302712 RepID=A0A3M7M7U2_9PLEO|nr:nuclear condensin complex subunit smc4 [Pyrenophora seminiperda CCB06]